MKHSPVLVTGATGFLGRHVLQALHQLQPQQPVLAVVRKRADWQANRTPGDDWIRPLTNVQPLEGGVTGGEAWLHDARLQGLGGIFHLAAVVKHSRRNTREVYETNIEGTLRMVRLAAQYGCRMVFVSSSGTVGCFSSASQAADEDAAYCEKTVANWPYYDSKIQAERKARALATELGVELVIVRPPVLLGPGDHRFRSTGHVLKFLTGRLPFLVDGGMHFIDIRDGAQAIVRAMGHPAARPVYHLPGTASSITEFFEMCRLVSGVQPPRRLLPFRAAWAMADAAERASHALGRKSPLPDPVVIEMAARHWGLRSRYAATELGYTSRPPLQTLHDTVAWLREHHEALR